MQLYRGKNAVNKFLQMMLQEVKNCRNIIKIKFNKPPNMTDDGEQHFQNATACHIFEKEYLAEDKRVRDHFIFLILRLNLKIRKILFMTKTIFCPFSIFPFP